MGAIRDLYRQRFREELGKVIQQQELVPVLGQAILNITNDVILPKVQEEIAAFIQQDLTALLTEESTSERDDNDPV